MHINLPFGGRADIFCDDGNDVVRYYNDVIINQEYGDVPPGPHETVVDLGANLGMFSLWIYNRAQRIYAIEASRSNYGNLVQTINANGLHKIKAFHVAIAGEGGERTLFSHGDCGGHNIVGIRDEASTVETVPAITLKAFLEANKIDRVDLLKIDVEGAEREIFSTPEFGDIAHKIPFIVGEFHADYMGQTMESIADRVEVNNALAALVRHGYKVTADRARSCRMPIFVARLSS